MKRPLLNRSFLHRLALLPLLLLCAGVSLGLSGTAQAATYSVRTSGNDTTGDGSSGNPWATVSKGIATAACGDTINVGSGTYSESTSGVGYLSVTKACTSGSPLTIQSESGSRADVTIQGASSATYNTLVSGTANGLHFKYLTFAPWTSTSTAALRISSGSNITFTGVDFKIPTDSTASRFGLHVVPSTGAVISTVTLTDCRAVEVTAHANQNGLYFGGTAADGITSPTLTDCEAVLTTGRALNLTGLISDFLVTGGRYVGSTYGVMVGQDSDVAIATETGTISGAEITTTTGHALLIGAGAGGTTTEYCRIKGGDYGTVVKENSGATLRYNRIQGGTGTNNASALYFKGATNANTHHNQLIATTGTQGVVKMGAGDTGNKCQNVTVTDSEITAYSIGIWNWAGDVADLGGGVVNRNTYALKGGANFGTVRASSSIAALTALRAAWAGYGDGSNDGKSRTKSRRTGLLY